MLEDMGLLDPLDFSNIPGYPNKLDKPGCLDPIPIFCKREDTVAKHVTDFKVLVA